MEKKEGMRLRKKKRETIKAERIRKRYETERTKKIKITQYDLKRTQRPEYPKQNREKNNKDKKTKK